ncbi:MAG: hypothetical protein ACUVTM_08390 [Candidatus Bathyarchaeia archaeon]
MGTDRTVTPSLKEAMPPAIVSTPILIRMVLSTFLTFPPAFCTVKGMSTLEIGFMLLIFGPVRMPLSHQAPTIRVGAGVKDTSSLPGPLHGLYLRDHPYTWM